MATMFCDIPDAERFHYRDAIEDAGGDVDGYDGPAVRVAMPNTGLGTFLRFLEEKGLVLDKDSLWFFPLGTDAPHAHLRHDGKYPGSKGFWLYGRFVPKSR